MAIRIDENLKKIISAKQNEIEKEKTTQKFTQDDVYDVFDELPTKEELLKIKKENNQIKIEKKNKVEKLRVVEKVKHEIKNNEEIESEKWEETENFFFSDLKENLKKIENNQQNLLKKMEELQLSFKTIKDTKIQKFNFFTQDEWEFLKLNLTIFNKKLIVFSTNSKNKIIKELLENLNEVSEYIFANSFHVFVTDNSPVKKVLENINYIGLNSVINDEIRETETILKQIDEISKKEEFERSFYYSSLLLEKGLFLNSIILLNEAISLYIVESAKTFSDKINNKISIKGEENKAKFYSQVKQFFISLFPVNGPEKVISFFHTNPYPKEIDKKIAEKFKNLRKTWKNKGDDTFFVRYSVLIEQIRKIRNELAHGNMEINFFNLSARINELSKEFELISIHKDIFKLKKGRKKRN